MFLNGKKVKIVLTTEEYNVVMRSLVEMRNRLIEDGRYTDAVDELLLKLIDKK